MLQTTVRNPVRSKALRLFFAIYPGRKIREEIAAIQTGFGITAEARRVPEENLHLTLAFLGEIAADRYLCYTQAAATLSPPNFKLRLDRLGYFSKASLCWLAPSQPPEALFALQRKLQTAITRYGFLDRRPFKPHVTLFRKASKLTHPQTFTPIEWHVDGFSLMQSVQQNHEVRYLLLEEYPSTLPQPPCDHR